MSKIEERMRGQSVATSFFLSLEYQRHITELPENTPKKSPIRKILL